jgi:hypothetical protein
MWLRGIIQSIFFWEKDGLGQRAVKEKEEEEGADNNDPLLI